MEQNLKRRKFLVRTAGALAGSVLASGGFPWGELAYGQQLKGKPVKFAIATRPDWTQDWFSLVNEELGLWKKYLPPGSEIEFTHPIHGGIVTTEMLSGKTMIGYLADAPGSVATFKREQADIRAIAVTSWSPPGYHLNLISVRSDAPEFKNSKEALQWLNDKIVAVPKGSSTDRFFQDVLEREGIKVKEYLNQPIGVITANLRAKRIDAMATWEPQGSAVSTLVGEGTARIISTGYSWKAADTGMILARKDFMDQQPEIVKAWLKSEIEAQLWCNDPKNHAAVLKMAQKHLPGISHRALWFSMAGLIPEPYYGGAIRDEKPFVWNDEIRAHNDNTVKYLKRIKSIPEDKYLPGAIDDTLARQAMKEMGVSSPLCRLKAVPLDKAYPLLTSGKIEEYANLFNI